MRKKNDICIKCYQARKMTLLTNEERGIMILKLLFSAGIEQESIYKDNENKEKYIEEEIEKNNREHEEKIEKNKTYRIIYEDIKQQLNYSQKKFDEANKRQNKKNNNYEALGDEKTMSGTTYKEIYERYIAACGMISLKDIEAEWELEREEHEKLLKYIQLRREEEEKE